MAQRPDFFIAGAAKCGTTALFHYLSRHSRIFMPRIKEPKFFCSDLNTRGGVYAYEEYLSLFAGVPSHCLTGEASTLYLYSKIAIERIMAHNPNARIIVMLRNPVAAAQSLHAAAWSHRYETRADFEQAWRAQEPRRLAQRTPATWPDAASLQYGAIYRYAPQVRRVLQHVPPDQRRILVYEEFFADPKRHYAELLEFLQVPPDNGAAIAFPVINAAVGARSQRLERWLREPPRWAERLYAPLRPLLRAARIRPRQMLWEINSVARPHLALRPGFRQELQRYFADDVAELEQLLGVRLWRGAGLPA